MPPLIRTIRSMENSGRTRRSNAVPKPPSGHQAQRGDTTQKAIRDAAISMFSEFGYHAVTLRGLADRIGIQGEPPHYPMLKNAS